ncbi:MAG: polysaccharide pyruvyl transferase family protein [Campylobacterales bacterium]|nr:polysaccharide pyruvyl transferase family protein [Campylobacterota bacterium]MBD3842218.1 polysaccharide pyruvyl transferase family protein [Campylobacterales bacterium]
MSKKILLMDTLSAIHVGNGALLENTIKLCKDAYGECEFNIMTFDKVTNRLKYNEDKLYDPMFGNFAIDKNSFHKIFWMLKQLAFMLLQIINEYTFKTSSKKLTFNNNQKQAITLIEKSDICISLGGEMIGDTFFKTLPFYLFNFWIASKKGKKFILFPQSVGPLKKGWTRKLCRWALRDAALLVGRDKPSYETLLSLGFDKDKVMFAPDVAIQQEIGNAEIYNYFNDKTKKIIGITISNPPHREMGQQVDFVQEIGSQIEKLDSNTYKILIMPSNYKLREISADYALCLKLKERLADKFEVAILENRPYFPDEYTALLGQLEFFVSTRMHVAILATTAFTPTIAINTQHKIMGYMKNINMEHFCVEYENLNTIFELSQEIVNTREQVVEDLKAANAKLKKEHEIFVLKLKEIVK